MADLWLAGPVEQQFKSPALVRTGSIPGLAAVPSHRLDPQEVACLFSCLAQESLRGAILAR